MEPWILLLSSKRGDSFIKLYYWCGVSLIYCPNAAPILVFIGFNRIFILRRMYNRVSHLFSKQTSWRRRGACRAFGCDYRQAVIGVWPRFASHAVAAMQSYLPVLCLPSDTKNIAPIHVDDLAALCLSLIGTVRALGCDVDCVGAEECSIASYVQALRQARGRSRAAVINVPNRWMRVGMECAAFCGARTITPEALDLMEHEHTGDKRAFTRWMRRQPQAIAAFQTVVH